ncbi:dimethylsulfonioproprionate lyase family protein [Dongia soli]|uniref:Dimethylsulfonioproprionate lyase family protein n=1 Tax=Dongia soli TaxID=600628 RepID=A0ABU5EBT0_9PROT|nr:dimethylsulfonioproprionate lyase family protein [Dongia soli]MDY0883727.1 dimethylsulfonioproprionate lyase family protein [Dongia soli]
MSRDQDLHRFIDALDKAIFQRLTPGSAEHDLARKIFDALKIPGEPGQQVDQEPLPAHQYLHKALETARSGPADLAAVADAFEALAPRLNWYRRKGSESAGPVFAEGHANTIIIGTEGLERRSDLQIGVSLLAPHIQYVDHHHPPPEVYLVLSPGAWRQEQGPWHEPGLGGIVYNTPDIVHAMKSGDHPLFAVWCLDWACCIERR